MWVLLHTKGREVDTPSFFHSPTSILAPQNFALEQETWPTPKDKYIDSHRHKRGSNPRLVDTARGLWVWSPPPPPAAMRSSTNGVGGGVVCLQFFHIGG